MQNPTCRWSSVTRSLWRLQSTFIITPQTTANTRQGQFNVHPTLSYSHGGTSQESYDNFISLSGNHALLYVYTTQFPPRYIFVFQTVSSAPHFFCWFIRQVSFYSWVLLFSITEGLELYYPTTVKKLCRKILADVHIF